MTVTNFIWDELSDNVLFETDENDAVTASYTNRPGQFGKLVSQKRNGVKSFCHFDGINSTSSLTDENEGVTDTYGYTAFGEEIWRTGTTENPFGYKGSVGYYTNSETNELYVRTRTYKPASGRWLSKDPFGFVDGPNMYLAYFVPNGVDPLGLTCAPNNCCCCIKELNYVFIRDLEPRHIVSTCFGKPTRVGADGYGNEFLLNLKFDKNISDVERPCILEWWEASNVLWEEGDKTVLLPGRAIEQVANLGERTNIFRTWNQDYKLAGCPRVGGNSFARDCPIYRLKNPNDKRLLCIKIVVRSGCEDCPKVIEKFFKQKCRFVNGKPKCTFEEGQCTARDWEEFGLKIDFGPVIWRLPINDLPVVPPVIAGNLA